jgi:hypothetical protein
MAKKLKNICTKNNDIFLRFSFEISRRNHEVMTMTSIDHRPNTIVNDSVNKLD